MHTLSNEQIELLAEKKLLGTITPEEQLLLNDWLNSQQAEQADWQGEDPDEIALKHRLLNRIKTDAGIGEHEYAEALPPLRSIGRRLWWAAAAVLIFATGGYFLLFNTGKQPTGIAEVPGKPHDITAPAVNRATLSLANGEKVYLDSAGNGSLALQGAVNIIKLADGQIAYTGSTTEIFYNTLTNPRGSKAVNITLSDGTKVWLNAESSLRYPVSFSGNERRVEITGEAYFEVTHNTASPFTVSHGDLHVKVLGTHFNVNAYKDEADIKVTLLEGSVKVTNAGNQLELIPGQQAKAITEGTLALSKSVDLEQVMAWRNELFLLKQADIKTVMRQIARWYDVDIEYKGEVKEKFIVDIDRNTNVSNVFKILEATGGVRFNIEGRKITVLL